jgi:hypothetical protein
MSCLSFLFSCLPHCFFLVSAFVFLVSFISITKFSLTNKEKKKKQKSFPCFSFLLGSDILYFGFWYFSAKSINDFGCSTCYTQSGDGKKEEILPPRPPRQKKSKLALFVCVSCVCVSRFTVLSVAQSSISKRAGAISLMRRTHKRHTHTHTVGCQYK